MKNLIIAEASPKWVQKFEIKLCCEPKAGYTPEFHEPGLPLVKRLFAFKFVFNYSNKQRKIAKKKTTYHFIHKMDVAGLRPGESFRQAIGFCGGDRNRTGVQTYSSKAFYMLISLLFVGHEQETSKPTHHVAG